MTEASKLFEIEPTADLITMVKKAVEMKKQIEELETELSDLKARFEVEQSELVQLMMDEGVQSVNADGVNVYNRMDMYFSVAHGKETSAFAFLYGLGLGHLVKETVNGNSLRSAFRALMDEKDIGPLDDEFEELIPRDLFKVDTRYRLGFRKSK